MAGRIDPLGGVALSEADSFRGVVGRGCRDQLLSSFVVAGLVAVLSWTGNQPIFAEFCDYQLVGVRLEPDDRVGNGHVIRFIVADIARCRLATVEGADRRKRLDGCPLGLSTADLCHIHQFCMCNDVLANGQKPGRINCDIRSHLDRHSILVCRPRGLIRSLVRPVVNLDDSSAEFE